MNLVFVDGLRQVFLHPSLKALIFKFLRLIGRQCHDVGSLVQLRGQLYDFLGGLDAILDWHVDVHEDKGVGWGMLPTEASLCHALMDHVESLLAIHGFFRLQMVLVVQDCL